MAGDWIKMRVDLADDPAVIRIAATLDLSEDDVVGKLHRLWSWADRHTIDGTAQGINERWVDRYVARQGFAAAMVSVTWLEIDDLGIRFPHFDRHNGHSAKRRCEGTVRQRLSREQRDKGVTGTVRDVIPRPFVRVVLARDGFQCVYCGSASSEKAEAHSQTRILSVDHLIPVTRGGQTATPNLATACKQCNGEKNDRTPEEWGLLPTFLQPGVTYLSHQLRDSRVTREEKRREEEESPKGDGETGSRRSRAIPSAEQVVLFQRRDGLVEYLRKKLEVKVLPDLKKQKGCALKLVKEYSDADCIAEFERQWSGGWRDKADWATVWSDIAQRKARANGVDHGEMPEIFRGAI